MFERLSVVYRSFQYSKMIMKFYGSFRIFVKHFFKKLWRGGILEVNQKISGSSRIRPKFIKFLESLEHE